MGTNEQHGTPRLTLLGRLRAYLFAGILVTAPAAITFYAAWSFITWGDRLLSDLIPAHYNPEIYLPFSVPGLGVVVLLSGLVVIGMLTAGFLGRFVVAVGESLLTRLPVISPVYGAIKQIFETVLAQRSNAFRQVVMIQYPRAGLWTLGFVSGVTTGEVREHMGEEFINVFVPTTPNPTSGFLLFVPAREAVVLDMAVDEGIKFVVSGGLITPQRKVEPPPADSTDEVGEDAGKEA